MSSSNHGGLHTAFLDWMSQQRHDLQELLHVLSAGDNNAGMLRRVAQKNIQHLQDYHHTRALFSGHHASAGDAFCIYSPPWCTFLENSLFWIGGFRPSIYIRLACSIFRPESEFGLPDLKMKKVFSKCREDMSDEQVKLIKGLHAKTVASEDKLSSRMADLQDGITTEQLVKITNDNASGQEINKAVAAHGVALGGIIADADELRVTVLKELIHILTPLQGIHFLVASNKLHLSVHEWGY